MIDSTVTVEEFKVTEIGPLPKEWEVTRLGQLIEEVREKNKSNFQHPVFTVSNLYGLVLSDEFFDKRVYSKKLNTYKLVRSDYFAYNPYRINVGSLALFDQEVGLVSPAYVVFTVSKPEYLYPPFLYRLIKSPRYLDEIRRIAMSRGSVRRSLSFRDLSDFQIPLPPLLEQKKIAYLLSIVQTAIEKTEAVINAIKELKKSLKKYLFAYGPVSVDEAESVPLKETEIGLVPEGWEVVRLRDVAQIRYGLGQPPDMDNAGVPLIRATNIKRGRITPTGVLHVKREAVPASRNAFLKAGDIIIVRSGAYTGDVALVSSQWEGAIAGYDLVVSPSSSLDSTYCSHFLLGEVAQSYFKSQRDRSAQPHLNSHELGATIVPIPSLSEQQRVSSILTAADRKIEAEENKKRALEALFKTLLTRFMTGKIRVNSLEVPV